MERSADREMMHSKSIDNLLHLIITGLICLLHAVLQDLPPLSWRRLFVFVGWAFTVTLLISQQL